jgi:hypothetical protein
MAFLLIILGLILMLLVNFTVGLILLIVGCVLLFVPGPAGRGPYW